MKSLEIQEGGSHYKGFVIQPAEYSIKNQLGFAEGNVVKYVTRYSLKGGLEDLKKARHYIDMLIEDAEERERQRQEAAAQKAEPYSDGFATNGWPLSPSTSSTRKIHRG